ncbi:MAG: RelA/SpoT family protein [bacterium]|nr:RelA/SpoT family protein [bacterium]MDZ4231366.1 RelA/SpoT family protein [Patescibacteria group bacterium]
MANTAPAKTARRNGPLPKTTPLIEKALNFAKKAHSGQKRKNGEPFINHSIATAKTLSEWGLDEDTIAAGLLHDTVEDTPVTEEELRQEFGEEISILVDGVTKISHVKYRGHERQVENLRKMVLAMAQDLRVLLIKLADRLHNMRTLDALPAPKRRRIALETMEVYAPLAYRLGMQNVSGELEDLAFPYIHPSEYRWLIKKIEYRYEEMEKYLKHIRPGVEKALKDAGVEVVSLNFRAKRYSSLYRKLLRYEMDIDRVHDLVAFRIIVKSVEDCYATLGVIHNLWTPMPGRIKDYIAIPKPNGYQSIHTSVICVDNRLVEFQIRTEQMHREAENGIAAHWAYEEAKGTKKYAKGKAIKAAASEVKWVEQLRSWQNEATNSREFIDSFKIDFLKDRIFAITPRGDIIDLPQGSTPVDFAYNIHSEIGNQCVGAKVNGDIVSLDYKLRSSDIVEIITQKGKKPSPNWLSFAATSAAKGHIRTALRGSKHNLRIERKQQVEFKITGTDRIGLLSEITGIVSRSHINIIRVQSEPKLGYYLIKMVCETADKDKVMKIIRKIKALKGVRKIDYRFV